MLFSDLSTPTSSCSDGELRLVGGTYHEGRVEVCFSQTWGSICKTEFGSDDVNVICRQLNESVGTLGSGEININTFVLSLAVVNLFIFSKIYILSI